MQERQAVLTLAAARLRGERSNVPRDSAVLYEAEKIGNNSAALNSGASSVSGGTFESDTGGTFNPLRYFGKVKWTFFRKGKWTCGKDESECAGANGRGSFAVGS